MLRRSKEAKIFTQKLFDEFRSWILKGDYNNSYNMRKFAKNS